MKVKIVNLCPHPITLVSGDERVTIPPDPAGPARCDISSVPIGEIHAEGVPFAIPVRGTKLGNVTSIPPRQEGVIFIVSRQVAEACPDRDDLFIVDQTVRDEQGRIVGAQALARILR